MYCPSCGAINSTEQKFCRACGLNLEKSAESLIEQMPSARNVNLLKQNQLLEKFGNFAFAGFGIVVLTAIAAIIFVIFSKMILSGTNVLAGILFVSFIIFGILTVIYIIFNEHLKEKQAKINPSLPNELTAARDTGKLLEERRFEPVPSITENSTELLFAETKAEKIK